MVQGIETDDKVYKHKRKDDIKYLSKDLNVFRRTVEKYIESIRPKDEKKFTTSGKKSKKRVTLVGIISILFLGLFGSISLITGIFLIIKQNYVIGVPIGVFGTVAVICFILYEKYN